MRAGPLRALRRFPIGLRTSLYAAGFGLAHGALSRAWAGRHAPPVIESDPGLRDPEYLARFLELFEHVAERYFRWEVRGIEHVPAQGPALLVGNHNGGIINTDSLLTLLAVWNHLGPGRALHPLAHDMLFFDAVLGRIASRMGVLQAGHQNAARVFRRGGMVLVYPGSDLDSWRTFRQRNRIELGGRKGFLKLVLRERVPIVPVVSAGTQEQFIVLSRGDEFARRTGLKRWLRAEACPIVVAAPWGLTSGYLPYLPLPAQTTIAFGEPLRFDELTPEDADNPVVLDGCYESVRGRMQELLDTVTVGRRWLIGQPPGHRTAR